jgi:hypothetical protein
MFTTTTRGLAEKVPLQDKSLRVSDAKFRTLADTTAAALFTCWGERLLLRMADRELRRMKSRGAKTVKSEEPERYASIR